MTMDWGTISVHDASKDCKCRWLRRRYACNFAWSLRNTNSFGVETPHPKAWPFTNGMHGGWNTKKHSTNTKKDDDNCAIFTAFSGYFHSQAINNRQWKTNDKPGWNGNWGRIDVGTSESDPNEPPNTQIEDSKQFALAGPPPDEVLWPRLARSLDDEPTNFALYDKIKNGLLRPLVGRVIFENSSGRRALDGAFIASSSLVCCR